MTPASSRIDTLIGELAEVGETLPAGLRAELLACVPDCVPHLIRVLEDEDLLDEDGPGEGWAPIHAARLLQEVHPPEAVEPLVRLMRREATDAFVSSAAMYALRACGAAAVDPTLKALGEESDTYTRAALREALAGTGVTSDAIFEALRNGPEEHAELGAISLAEYGDPRAMPILQKALDDHEVADEPIGLFENTEVIEYCESIERLGGELTEPQQQKLKKVKRQLEASRPKIAAYRRERYGDEPGHEPPKPGRNDPCWCGSGKKYKKCHWAEDRQR